VLVVYGEWLQSVGMENETTQQKGMSFLTEKNLVASIAKADAVRSALCDELIAAGRGHERHSDTAAKSDPLSLRYLAASAAYVALSDERRYRMTYHGSMKPVRKLSAA